MPNWTKEQKQAIYEVGGGGGGGGGGGCRKNGGISRKNYKQSYK